MAKVRIIRQAVVVFVGCVVILGTGIPGLIMAFEPPPASALHGTTDRSLFGLLLLVVCVFVAVMTARYGSHHRQALGQWIDEQNQRD